MLSRFNELAQNNRAVRSAEKLFARPRVQPSLNSGKGADPVGSPGVNSVETGVKVESRHRSFGIIEVILLELERAFYFHRIELDSNLRNGEVL
jgi:hypothetical protein